MPSLAAQGGFIKPEVLDSATAVMRDSYVSIRDTLRAVSGKSAILQRDVRTATDAVLLSRARGLEGACSASLRHLDGFRSRMLGSEAGRRAPVPGRTQLDRAFLELRATLTTCATEYKGMSRMDQAGEMRGRGVNLALRNQLAIRNFETAGEAYLLSFGIRVRPHGAGASPYAGTTRSSN